MGEPCGSLRISRHANVRPMNLGSPLAGVYLPSARKVLEREARSRNQKADVLRANMREIRVVCGNVGRCIQYAESITCIDLIPIAWTPSFESKNRPLSETTRFACFLFL